ncbi:MAG TPA: ATP-dependent DNA helicase [Thermoleophilaceae bacterium]|nr:ATP-dependent DNA helicase [Thermoleophilaceae bacterium]
MRDPLDGLNDAQAQAVTHLAGPALVIGGAGTGKSEALARRFAWLAARGESPAAVLALSPSPAGAARLRARVEELLEPPWEELHVTTLPDFCCRLLREEAHDAGLDPFFAHVSRAERLALLLERIDDLTLRTHEIRGNPVPLLVAFLERIDALKGAMITAEEYGAHARELADATADADDAARANAAREAEFAGLYADHDRLVRESGGLDTGDLVLRAFRLLHERPDVRLRASERFSHVLVDDLQDTGFGEGLVLRLLCQDHRRVWAAGDDDQGIHRFRAASRKNFRDFRREYEDNTVFKLSVSHRCAGSILAAAQTVVAAGGHPRIEKELRGPADGSVAFWRCQSPRAEAQAIAAAVEHLVRDGVEPDAIGIFVRSVRDDGSVLAAALEERGVPARLSGTSAYFQRLEVRDLLAWLRLLADPGDSGAVVRALSRPPIELRSVDIARLTQLARRRKLDMISGVVAACDGPQLSPEGRDRALAFLRLHRRAARAFESMQPDAFVHRLIERIGIRRQQLFASQADTAERLANISKLVDLAGAYVRRYPQGTPRDFARYLTAVAEAGLPEDEIVPAGLPSTVAIVSMHAARDMEVSHAFVAGLDAAAVPGSARRRGDGVPDALLRESVPEDGVDVHEALMRRLLHVAITRARRSVVLSWAEDPEGARPSPFYEDARRAAGAEEEFHEEQLFGPAEGLHATFRMMRDEVLDSVSRVAGRLGEMRLDTYMDVASASVRFLELLKVAALVERTKEGQTVAEALPEINEILLQAATPEERELFLTSALDEYLSDEETDAVRRARAIRGEEEQSLEAFIPRRGDGLMLSASDIETYRLCPLKYKFARVFRIPQEPTINQRFGIVVHQVLERFHTDGGGSLDTLMQLFEASWRRSGFGDSNDDLQFRAKAVAALTRYWELDQKRAGKPVWFERGFSFKLGPHLVRGRVDRVDELPDGSFELIDYKTGRPKSEDDLRDDIQLSLYQVAARESWEVEARSGSYYYVLDNEKVPVAHSDDELARVKAAVTEIADSILEQEFEPKPSYELCSFCDYRIICPAAEK